MVLFHDVDSSPFFKEFKIIAPQIIAIFEYRFQFSTQTHKTAYILNLFPSKNDGPVGFDVGGENTTAGNDIKIHIQHSFAT